MTDLKTEILAHLVSFDTTSRNSNLELLDWVEDYLSRHGIAATRVFDETSTKANLWATIGPEDRAGYVLSGHTDTVPVDDQPWTTDPFSLVAKGGRLYGRGTTDMKGFLACCLAKVPDMLARPLVHPIHLAFSHDEEIGCVGVRSMLRRMGDLAPRPPRACFVGEPTGMQVILAHKARYTYRGTVHGKACHSSLAPEGANAIDAAAELILLVRDIARRLAAEGPRDPLYDVPFSTAHTGTVSGGTVLNIVPESCSFEFEFRMLPGVDHRPYEAEVRALAARIETEMRRRDPACRVDIEVVTDTAGFDIAPEAEAVVLAKRLAGRNDHAKVAYGTEAGLFVSMAGIPTVVVGPGSIEQAHKPDEFIEVAEMERCSAFLDRLLLHCS